jgi:hypothetical protein
MKLLLIVFLIVISSVSLSENSSAKDKKSTKSANSAEMAESEKSSKNSKKDKSAKSSKNSKKSAKTKDDDSSKEPTSAVSVDDQNKWEALVEKYLTSGKSNPDYIHDQTEYLYLVNDIANNELIFFTREAHISHPSFARIYHHSSGPKTSVRISAFTLGDKNQYDLFIHGDVQPMRYELRRKLEQ